MYIQCCTPIFTGRTKTQLSAQPHLMTSNQLAQTEMDTFERKTFDVTKDLNKLELREFINEGRTRKVYKTNFDGIVIGLVHGETLKKGELKAVNDPAGLTIAKNDGDTIRVMKHIKGKPLYGQGWSVYKHVPKNKYMTTFHRITGLPDETFKEYIRNFVRIKENGYDVDTTNPNNFLLDRHHIGIVDLDKAKKPYERPYKLSVADFDALINRHDIKYILDGTI